LFGNLKGRLQNSLRFGEFQRFVPEFGEMYTLSQLHFHWGRFHLLEISEWKLQFLGILSSRKINPEFLECTCPIMWVEGHG